MRLSANEKYLVYVRFTGFPFGMVLNEEAIHVDCFDQAQSSEISWQGQPASPQPVSISSATFQKGLLFAVRSNLMYS